MNREKHARVLAAVSAMEAALHAAAPDILLVFGDDQGEQFHFDNFPAFAVFVGEEYAGYKVSPWQSMYVPGETRVRAPRNDETWVDVKSHAPFARHLTEGLVRHKFDLAFSTRLPDPAEGMGHAFMRPSYFLRPGYDLPTVPFFVNCYFEPQPTGERCYELGVAVRQADRGVGRGPPDRGDRLRRPVAHPRGARRRRQRALRPGRSGRRQRG